MLIKKEPLSRQFVHSALWVAAGINLGVGLARALGEPARGSDLWTMYGWCRAWLLNGVRLYSAADAATDYPPGAIVTLAPMALVPEGWLVPAWTILTLALTPLFAYLVMRAIHARITWSEALVPMLLFLCWGGARTFLEFSRLSLTLAFASVVLARSRPAASGICLGLALGKPQIAGPVALWMIATRRLYVTAIAAVVVVAGVIVYCVRAHANPLAELEAYRHIISTMYGGADGLMGWTSLREWAHALTPTPARGDTLWLTTAGVLLIVAVRMAAVGAGSRSNKGERAALAALCVWSLLTFYHIGNNFILMLPAFAFLWFVHDPPTRLLRLWLVGLIEVAMIADVPLSYVVKVQPWAALVDNLDRFVVLTTFVVVVALWQRQVAPRAESRKLKAES